MHGLQATPLDVLSLCTWQYGSVARVYLPTQCGPCVHSSSAYGMVAPVYVAVRMALLQLCTWQYGPCVWLRGSGPCVRGSMYGSMAVSMPDPVLRYRWLAAVGYWCRACLHGAYCLRSSTVGPSIHGFIVLNY